MISVLDYGIGNNGSILNMLRAIGIAGQRIETPSEIEAATGIILPGVGAFDAAMQALCDRALVTALRAAALERSVPILGICLGMQLLTEGSDEGALPGLGLLRGRARALRAAPQCAGLCVPHMGWNRPRVLVDDGLLESGGQARFYFVHSYHVVLDDCAGVVAEAEYGIRFAAAIREHNIHGVQFHPEKSHRHGMAVLRRFAAELQRCAPA